MTQDKITHGTQEELTTFLRADLELAFTMLQTVAIDIDHDPEDAAEGLQRAAAALAKVRELVPRVQDSGVRAEINAKATDLESAIRKCRWQAGQAL